MHRLKMLILSSMLTGIMAGVAFAQAPPPPDPKNNVSNDTAASRPITSNSGNGVTNTKNILSNYVPVTDTILQNPDPSNWIMYRGNYAGWGYSPLDQVNKTNVKNLQLVWARVMEPGINESTPLIYNGMMFLGNSSDVIQAINATTGDLVWEYRRKLPSPEALHSTWGQRKRSIFLYGDKVYFDTWDNYVVALDAKSGAVDWETNRGGDLFASNSSGPIVADGIVISGATCQVAGFGCYVTGNDANSGEELWRNTLIPRKGEPGDDTWGDTPFESRWITGAWGPITYDPQLDLAYYGSTGVGPSSEVQRGCIGCTMAGTDTRFAVKPKTGEIAWKHQVLPEDNWDQECTFEMMIINTPVHPDPTANGMLAVGANASSPGMKTLTGVPCKTAIAWSFDAANGNFLWAKSTSTQNLVAKIDNTGLVSINQDMAIRDNGKLYHMCPTFMGGRDEPASAYSPKTNALYVQLQNLCFDVKALDRAPLPAYSYNISATNILAPGKTNVGRIDAVSVETGKTLWSWETPVSNYSPVLATAGGLIFNGGMDRYLRAIDQDSGKLLWQTRLASQAFGNTVTYSVDGKQYVAITAGGGFNAGALGVTPGADGPSGGNAVYVFALPPQ